MPEVTESDDAADGAADGRVDAADVAATERVRTVLEGLTRIELGVMVVSPPDQTRLDAQSRARTVAVEAGRRALLDDAVAAARHIAMRAFAGAAFSGTWALSEMAAGVATSRDRAAAAAAFEEAATAAVVEDLVDADTLEVLRATTDELILSTGLPAPGSLAGFTSLPSGATGPFQVALGIAVLVAGLVVGLLAGLGAGLLVIAGGFAILAIVARRRSGGPA